jgi:hypothetical protein
MRTKDMTSPMLTRYVVAVLALASLGSIAQAQSRRRPVKPPKPHSVLTAEAPAPPPSTPAVPAVEPNQVPTTAPAPTSGSLEAPPLRAVPDAIERPAGPVEGTAEVPAGDREGSKASGEIAALRQDLAQVMDELVQARARVGVLGKALFKTKVRVKIDNRAAPDQVAIHAGLWLDGAPIWKGEGSALADPERTLFEGFVTPGPHVLTFEVEQRARQDAAYRYTLHESYHFNVLRDRRTDLRLLLLDDSDMADDFADDEEGEYDVRTRFQVRAVALDDD